jgi:Mg2+ and Co2+ transporter CorA
MTYDGLSWEDIVTNEFPSQFSAEYVTTLKFHCMTLRDVVRCTPDDLRELGVRMGHRAKLLAIAEDFDSRMARIDAVKNRQVRRQSISAAYGDDPARAGRKTHGDHHHHANAVGMVTTKGTEVEWIDTFGSSPTLEIFLEEMRHQLHDHGFPTSFNRFFVDNKPMPFTEGDGALVVGILLRLPDLEAEEGGCSVTVITNRLVILLAVDEGLIFTYHRGDLELVTLFRDSWEGSDFKGSDIGTILEAILRRALRTYEIAVNELREEADLAATEQDEVKAVQSFTMIQKKANVYERCARASIDALEEASEMEHCEGLKLYLKGMCDRLRTVQSMCEEVQSNALSAVDLNIALAEFRSSTNLKIFTYITILSQPVAVATSWYGMNWESMHEFKDPDAYKIFVPTVITFSVLLCVFIMLREKILFRVMNKLRLKGVEKPSGKNDGEANREQPSGQPNRESDAKLAVADAFAAEDAALAVEVGDADEQIGRSFSKPKSMRKNPMSVS